MRYFVLLFFIFLSFASYSQCSLSVTKTDITCAGGSNGTATVSVSGTATINSCMSPEISSESCASCTTPANPNASITVGNNQKICITGNSYTGTINLNSGGKVVVCGTGIKPGTINFNGGTLVINSSASMDINILKTTGSGGGSLINYGTLVFLNSTTVNFNFFNHGTANVNAGNFTVGTNGVILNTNQFSILTDNFISSGSVNNSGTLTALKGQMTLQAGSFTNYCTLKSASMLIKSGFSNQGQTVVSGSIAHMSGTITLSSGTEIIANDFTSKGTVTGTGTNCSSIKTSTGTLQNGCVFSGQVKLCGSVNNPAGIATSFLNCTCDVTKPACSYVWNNVATGANVGTGATISNLRAGTYRVTPMCNGCNASSTTVTINEPTPLTLVPTITTVGCFGESTGTISVQASGGNSPYTFTWNNGATGQTVSNLAVGSYTIVVTDSKGCSKSQTFSVTQPESALTVTGSAVDVSCFSQSTGAINLTVNGGTTPYTYLWSNSANSQNLSSIQAGPYNVTVTDGKGCQKTFSTVVNQPASSLSLTSTVTDVTCFGESTGSINVTTSGGTVPYSYSWSNGPTTSNLSSVASGVYKVTVTDSKLCTTESSVTVNQPSDMIVTSDVVGSNCSTDNGTINLNITGGSSPYTFSWNTGATTQNLTGVGVGNYTVTVTDVNNCTKTSTATVDKVAQFTVTSTKKDVTCFGNSDGTIDVTVTGGAEPYTYLWSNGSITEDLTGLSFGNYSVTVNDSKGCSQVFSFIINTPNAPLSASGNITPISCNGKTDGAIDLSVVGGIAPYTYSWDNSGNTEDISSLGAGIYTVLVTDANGCITSLSESLIEPSPIDFNLNTNDVYSYGTNTGSAYLNIINTGGIGIMALNYCATPQKPYMTCATGCSTTISTDAGDITVNQGQTLCLTAPTFSSNITIDGGLLLICGSATPASLTSTEKGGNVFVNGSLTMNNYYELNQPLYMINFGTVNFNGGLSLSSSFNNAGTVIIKGSLVVNQAPGYGYFSNQNKVVVEGNIENHNYINNSASMIVTNDLNNYLQFYNVCTLTVNQAINNTGYFANYRKTDVGTTFTSSAGSRLEMPGGTQIDTKNLVLSGEVYGPYNYPWEKCSNIKISGNTTINSGSTFYGEILNICDANGVETNNEPTAQPFIHCGGCDLNFQSCGVLWSTGEVTNYSQNLYAGDYSVTVGCGTCSLTKNFKIKQRATILINTVNANPGTFTVTAPGAYPNNYPSGFPYSETYVYADLPEPGKENEILINIDQTADTKPLDLKLTYNSISAITSVKAKVNNEFMDINQEYYDILQLRRIYFYADEKPLNKVPITTNLVNGIKLDPATKSFQVNLPSNYTFTSSLLSINKINNSVLPVYGPNSNLTWDGSGALPGVYEFNLQLENNGVTKSYKGQFIIE